MRFGQYIANQNVTMTTALLLNPPPQCFDRDFHFFPTSSSFPRLSLFPLLTLIMHIIVLFFTGEGEGESIFHVSHSRKSEFQISYIA